MKILCIYYVYYTTTAVFFSFKFLTLSLSSCVILFLNMNSLHIENPRVTMGIISTHCVYEKTIIMKIYKTNINTV